MSFTLYKGQLVYFSLNSVSVTMTEGRICIKPYNDDQLISEIIRQSGCWEAHIVRSVLVAMMHFPTATFLGT